MGCQGTNEVPICRGNRIPAEAIGSLPLMATLAGRATVFLRSLVPAALAETLAAGCGSAHRKPTAAQLEATGQSANPVLACIAKRAPTAHTTVSAESLEASWAGGAEGERLSVMKFFSASQAAYVAAKLKAKEKSGEAHFMVVAVAAGRSVVQWGPQAPTVEQGAVLKGCLP